MGKIDTCPVAEQRSKDKNALVSGIRAVREAARSKEPERPELPPPPEAPAPNPALPPLRAEDASEAPASPERDALNSGWDVLAGTDAPEGALARLLSPLRGPLRRVIRFALGPALERQVSLNSAQVRFDNEIVAYLDARIDRLSAHYDPIMGQHGRRMEEIDERHLVLQQELIRHVHDLVSRIEFVFESAETNHLYIDGLVRESREALGELDRKLEALAAARDDGP